MPDTASVRCHDDPRARLARVTVPPDTRLGDAIARLDAAGTGVLLLTDADGRLRGIVTDGDVRRAILHGTDMVSPLLAIATQEPIVGRPDMAPDEMLHLMDHNPKGIWLNHLPVVDGGGQPSALCLRSDFVPDPPLGVSAVVMAGGFGTRLRPLTNTTPKPMLPVGDRPLLELIIRRLQQTGIRRVRIATHFQRDVIREYFGDGRAFDVDITYLDEDRPLGTAGALSLMELPPEPLLVMNGDILTQVDFRAMLSFHREHQAVSTVAVRQYEINVPYGVMDCEGIDVAGIREKPDYRFFVNAGVYLLEPIACRQIQPGERCDMTELIRALIAGKRRVICFPVTEYWLDIGEQVDYLRAQADVRAGRVAV